MRIILVYICRIMVADARMQRWQRKLNTLTPDSPEYKKHMKQKPKPTLAKAETKRVAGKKSSSARTPKVNPRVLEMWDDFKLIERKNTKHGHETAAKPPL